jgi:small-conductance mechanosensitive channel
MNEAFDSLSRVVQQPLVRPLLTVVVALVVAVVLVRLVQSAATRYIADRNTRFRVRKAIGLFGYALATLIVASSLSERLSGLTVMLGVITAGIAFALQEVIASVAGWAAVSLGGYYKAGDRVQLGGIRGDVVDIGLLRTTLFEVGQWVDGDLYNGRVVRVANSFVFKEPVVNYSGDFPFLWDELRFEVRFGSDLARVEEILRATAEEVCGAYAEEATAIWRDIQKRLPLEDASTRPMVTMTFDHNWVTFVLRYAVRYDRRRATKHELSTRVLQAFETSEGAVRVAASALEISQPRG